MKLEKKINHELMAIFGEKATDNNLVWITQDPAIHIPLARSCVYCIQR